MKILRYENNMITLVTVQDDYILHGNEIIYTEENRMKYYSKYKPAIINSQIIELAAPDEIIVFQRQKEFEQDLEFARQKKADGQQFYEEIDARQVAMMRGKTPDEIDDLDVEYKRKILPYIEVVNGGQWWTAKRLMNNTTLPKIDIVRDLFLEVRQRIRDYVTNNYPV